MTAVPAVAARPGRPRASASEPERSVTILARAVRRRVTQPVDVLEIAAVLESGGITDTIAAQDYGALDTFDLAERVFAILRERAPRQGGNARTEESDRPLEDGARFELVRGAVALAPVCACVALFVLLAWSGLSSGTVLALGIGTTLIMVPANGFIQAIGRRTAIYLGLHDRVLARQFLVCAGGFALAAVALLGGVGITLAGWAGWLTPSQRAIVWVGAVALAAFWLLVSATSLAGGGHWTLAALAAAAIGGLVVARATPLGPQATIAAGVITACVLAIAVLVYGCRRLYGATVPSAPAFPPTWGVALELSPYFAYGALFMALLVVSHVLGWVAALAEGDATFEAIRTLELPLTLGLVPILLASGIADRSVRLFWTTAERLQRVTGAERPARFRSALLRLHTNRLIRHQAVIAAIALLTFLVFDVAVRAGLLPDVLRPGDVRVTELALGCALVAYWHVGLGQFNCGFLLSLGVPRPAASAALCGVAALTLIGVPLAAVSYVLTPLAFVVGSIVFAGLSLHHCRAALARADYHYAIAF